MRRIPLYERMEWEWRIAWWLSWMGFSFSIIAEYVQISHREWGWMIVSLSGTVMNLRNIVTLWRNR